MTTPWEAALCDLAPPVPRVLGDFLANASESLGDTLVSAVMFGSAAEGRLRATSDVNLLLVLTAFEPERVDGLRESLRVAQAAVRLAPMFLLESELAAAAESFAAKFADMRRRHRLLFGRDLLPGLSISREAGLRRLRQILLNLEVRLRLGYALRSLREEQLALLIADVAGPLRSAAGVLLELQGHSVPAPRVALASAAAGMPAPGIGDALERLSEARETRVLPPGVARPTFFRLLALAEHLRSQAQALKA